MLKKSKKSNKPKSTDPKQIKNVQPIRDLKKIEDMKWALNRHCSERDFILFILGLDTGLRVGDLLRLTKNQITSLKSKREKVLKVVEGKTKKKRDIVINEVFDEVYQYASNLESDWLFPSRKGDKAISPTQAYRQLNKAADFAGVDNVGNHTLRKTYGYWFYKQHKDIAMLQHILNHAAPDITLGYIGITDEEIRNAQRAFSLFRK